MFEDDEDDYDNDDPFGAEVNVFERVGFGRIGDTTEAKLKTPLDKFISKVEAIALDLGLETDINDMTSFAEKVNRPDYKNVTAYILGYIASSGGYRITDQSRRRSMDLLNRVDDKSVQPVDVIRYARYWINVLRD